MEAQNKQWLDVVISLVLLPEGTSEHPIKGPKPCVVLDVCCPFRVRIRGFCPPLGDKPYLAIKFVKVVTRFKKVLEFDFFKVYKKQRQ